MIIASWNNSEMGHYKKQNALGSSLGRKDNQIKKIKRRLKIEDEKHSCSFKNILN